MVSALAARMQEQGIRLDVVELDARGGELRLYKGLLQRTKHMLACTHTSSWWLVAAAVGHPAACLCPECGISVWRKGVQGEAGACTHPTSARRGLGAHRLDAPFECYVLPCHLRSPFHAEDEAYQADKQQNLNHLAAINMQARLCTVQLLSPHRRRLLAARTIWRLPPRARAPGQASQQRLCRLPAAVHTWLLLDHSPAGHAFGACVPLCH